MKPIHEIIAAICRKRGLTAYELARRAGVPPQGVRRFLKGERGLTTPTLDKVLEALELTVQEPQKAKPERPRSAMAARAPVADLDWGWIEGVARRHQIPTGVLIEAAVLEYALARGWPHNPPPRREHGPHEPSGGGRGEEVG